MQKREKNIVAQFIIKEKREKGSPLLVMTQAKAFCKKRTQANTKQRVLSGLKICNLFIYNILNAFLDANTPHPVFVFIRIFLINNMLICSLPLKEPAGQIRCDTTRTPSPPAMGQTEHNGTLPGGAIQISKNDSATRSNYPAPQ
jgi:hypothetical protein